MSKQVQAMPNSPLDASDMPTVLPGQVSPGQPAMRSPLSQEAHKALEVLRYNLPFVPIMPLSVQSKIIVLSDSIAYNLDFPDGSLAVYFSCSSDDGSTNAVFASLRGNPVKPTPLSGLAENNTFFLPFNEWLYCENVKQISVMAHFGGPVLSARFYVQL